MIRQPGNATFCMDETKHETMKTEQNRTHNEAGNIHDVRVDDYDVLCSVSDI